MLTTIKILLGLYALTVIAMAWCKFEIYLIDRKIKKQSKRPNKYNWPEIREPFWETSAEEDFKGDY